MLQEDDTDSRRLAALSQKRFKQERIVARTYFARISVFILRHLHLCSYCSFLRNVFACAVDANELLGGYGIVTRQLEDSTSTTLTFGITLYAATAELRDVFSFGRYLLSVAFLTRKHRVAFLDAPAKAIIEKSCLRRTHSVAGEDIICCTVRNRVL